MTIAQNLSISSITSHSQSLHERGREIGNMFALAGGTSSDHYVSKQCGARSPQYQLQSCNAPTIRQLAEVLPEVLACHVAA